MPKVTDPNLLAQLNASPAAPAVGGKVTDPSILAALNGGAPQPVQPGQKIDIMDVFNRQTHQGIYAPKAPQPIVQGNPQASPLPGVLGQAANTFRAATQGAMDASTLNLGDEITAGLAVPLNAAVNAGSAGLNRVTGGFVPQTNLPTDYGTLLHRSEGLSADAANLNPQAFGVGQMAGTLGLMGEAGKGSKAVVLPAKGLIRRTALQSGAIGATMGFGEPGSIPERLQHAAAGGLAGAALGALGGKVAEVATRDVVPPNPKADQLFAAARTAFQNAELKSGAVTSQPASQMYAQDVRSYLIQKGAITPSGKVASYPAVSHALNLAEDFGQAPMTVAQWMTLRDNVADAAGSAIPKERKLGVTMLKMLDDHFASLPPQAFVAGDGAAAVQGWTQGRALWHLAEKGKTVGDLISGARRQADKSTAVPVEQALRNKFAAFAAKDKNLRGFTPAEREALINVGEGTPIGNVAKKVGALAPTTLGGLTWKAGVPFAVGNMIGGPVAGGALATGSLGIGYAGRIISRLSTQGQAELARTLVLNGGKLPKSIPNGLSAPVKKAIGNLMMVGAGSAGTDLQKMLNAPQAAGP